MVNGRGDEKIIMVLVAILLQQIMMTFLLSLRRNLNQLLGNNEINSPILGEGALKSLS